MCLQTSCRPARVQRAKLEDPKSPEFPARFIYLQDSLHRQVAHENQAKVIYTHVQERRAYTKSAAAQCMLCMQAAWKLMGGSKRTSIGTSCTKHFLLDTDTESCCSSKAGFKSKTKRCEFRGCQSLKELGALGILIHCKTKQSRLPHKPKFSAIIPCRLLRAESILEIQKDHLFLCPFFACTIYTIRLLLLQHRRHLFARCAWVQEGKRKLFQPCQIRLFVWL